jgi:hypothetical protein
MEKVNKLGSFSSILNIYFRVNWDEIIKVEVSVSVMITLTETLIIEDITKTEFNNCFIMYGFSK